MYCILQSNNNINNNIGGEARRGETRGGEATGVAIHSGCANLHVMLRTVTVMSTPMPNISASRVGEYGKRDGVPHCQLDGISVPANKKGNDSIVTSGRAVLCG